MRKPVISPELANRIADWLLDRGYSSPYTTCGPNGEPGVFHRFPDPDPFIPPHDYVASNDWRCRVCAKVPDDSIHHGVTPWTYKNIGHYVAETHLFGDLPKFWTVDVANVLGERGTRARHAALRGVVETIDTTPAIRQFLRENVGSRGFAEPKLVDLSGLRTSRRNGVEATLGEWVRLDAAVRFAYAQEAWADHIRWAIPIAIADDFDVEARRHELARWCEALRTHTGWAGSGSTFSTELMVNPDGAFLVLDERVSIPD